MKEILHTYKGFLFDLNGTMIDDMAYHMVAWNDILNNELKAGLSYEQVKAQMYGKNDELLIRVFGEGRFSAAEMQAISMEKERRYQQAYLPVMKLIPGLEVLLPSARALGQRMAIGSAAIPFNINFVLDNLHLRHYFDTVVSADDVTISKPHPDTYLQCAERLGLAPNECVVFEDAPKGVEAAANAGMNCFVLTTLHRPDEFKEYSNILGFLADYSPLLESV